MDQKFGEDRDFHTRQTHSAEEHARHDVELEASYRALLSVAVIGQGRGEEPQTVASPRDIPVVQTQAQEHQQRTPFAPNSHGEVQQQEDARQQQTQDHQLQAQQQGHLTRQQAPQQPPNQPLQPAQPQSMQQVQQHQARQNTLQQLMQQPVPQTVYYLQILHQQYPQRAQELQRLLDQNGYFQQKRPSHRPQQPVDPRSQQQPHAPQQLHTQMQHPYHSQPQQQPQPSSRAPSSPYVSPSSLLGPGQPGAGYMDVRNQQTQARIPLAAPPGEPGGAGLQPGLASHQISQVRVGNAATTAVNPTSGTRTPVMNSPAVQASSVKSRVRTTLPQQSLPRERYYQYIDSLLAGPVPLKPNSALVKFGFDISESDFKERAQVGMARDGGSLVYGYFEGCRRMYFRICAMPIRTMGEDSSTIAENKWATAQTVWPEVLTAKVNEDGFVEFARKREFGRNLPCEITGYLKPGRNVLSVGVMLPPPEGYCFYGAVELVHTASLSSIMSTTLAQRVLAETDTVNTIKSRLSMSPGDGDGDDDEIQIMDPEICINLADPYSGSLVDVPCRGEACAHLDVFDLRTLLETRAVKESCAHGTRVRGGCPECVARPSERLELSQTDVWGCPICNEDVRPGHIVVDGFLKGVVEELKREGGDARVVLVDAEGKWRVKVEAKKAMKPRESIVISD
ncbi:uncharacterized protein DNG_02408 [Cephalotrichum gorgonifer]|uniref:SP-RING-type domain-containing protein n=1 Tax=Cephalotrichum gorgonifer TaxID=2041049 RepID=A0AAE8MTX2_9PEZI|nr:uncharacterized protein DNG_02408 [Cephalotrichum gorgonifer]